MQLFDAILKANESWVHGDKNAKVPRADFADSLPVVALTCVEGRVNPLLPHVLGLEDHDLVLLRTPGNVITGALSGTVRALALACAIKESRQIAVIGHTDCLVGKTTVLKLTDALAGAGVAREKLPENLTEFFGLFASERQNVIKAVDFLRQSPMIGPKITVHGLLLDIQSGRVEWLVNGYQAPAATVSELKIEARIGDRELMQASVPMPSLKLGEMKFPDLKIGDVTVSAKTGTTPAQPISPPDASLTSPSGKPTSDTQQPSVSPPDWQKELTELIGQVVRVHVIGNDMKRYGPASVEKLIEWIAEKRIGENTPAVMEGTNAWQPLYLLIRALKQAKDRQAPTTTRKPGVSRLFRPGH